MESRRLHSDFPVSVKQPVVFSLLSVTRYYRRGIARCSYPQYRVFGLLKPRLYETILSICIILFVCLSVVSAAQLQPMVFHMFLPREIYGCGGGLLVVSINARTTVFLSLGLGFSGQDISSVRRAAEPCEVLHGGQFSVCLFAVCLH